MSIKYSAWIKQNFPKFKQACAEEDITINITEGVRTPEVQAAYYAQGREPLAKVNAARKSAGLVPIDEKTNRYQITGTLYSAHIFGYALDVVIVRSGSLIWDSKDPEYKRIADIGENLGFRAGYYFNRVDACHFERMDD